MVENLAIDSDDDGFVFVEERLITGSRINDGEALMGQIAVTVLMKPTPVWPTVLQSALTKKNTPL